MLNFCLLFHARPLDFFGIFQKLPFLSFGAVMPFLLLPTTLYAKNAGNIKSGRGQALPLMFLPCSVLTSRFPAFCICFSAQTTVIKGLHYIIFQISQSITYSEIFALVIPSSSRRAMISFLERLLSWASLSSLAIKSALRRTDTTLLPSSPLSGGRFVILIVSLIKYSPHSLL